MNFDTEILLGVKCGVKSKKTDKILIPKEYDKIFGYLETHICKINNELIVFEKYEDDVEYISYYMDDYYRYYNSKYEKILSNVYYSFKTPICSALKYKENKIIIYDINGNNLCEYTFEGVIDAIIKCAKNQVRLQKLKTLI